MNYNPLVNIQEPAIYKALNQLSDNLVTYWLSVPYFLLWSKFFDIRCRQRVRVAWEGHTHIMEVYV